MTTRTIGQALRLLGPALQVLCLIPLLSRFGARARGETSTLEVLCYVGFVAGFVLVLVGIVLASWGGRRSGPEERRGDEERPGAGDGPSGQDGR